MTEIFQGILVWLTGSDPDTRVELEHTLPISPFFVVLLWGCAVTWAGVGYWKCRGLLSRPAWYGLFALRCAAITVLLFGMLAGWRLKREMTDRPDLLILIDDSASMLQVDRYSGRSGELVEEWFDKPPQLVTRLEIAKGLLAGESTDFLDDWRKKYRVRIVRVATTSRDLDGSGSLTEQVNRVASSSDQTEFQASRLGEEIVRQLRTQRGRPLAAIIVVSDGVTTIGRTFEEAAEYADRKNVPLFCVGVGDTIPNRDAEVREVLADRTVFLGDTVQVDVAIAARSLKGETVELQLRRKGTSEILDSRVIATPQSGMTSFHRLSFRPESLGEKSLLVQIEPVRDEVNLSNNRLPFQVDVRDETIRALYIQGYPSPDFRFLKTLLQRKRKISDVEARAIDLTTVQFEAETGAEDLDSAAAVAIPTDINELAQFDVILLGDVPSRRLPTEFRKSLMTYIGERGGGLVLLPGPRHLPKEYVHTEIASLFPYHLDSISTLDDPAIASQGLFARPTHAGLQNPPMRLADGDKEAIVQWTTMPPLRWITKAERLRPAAQPWLEVHAPGTRFDGIPLIVSQYVGAGRVVCHLTDESYRWARHRDGETGYEHYWMQLLRYLAHNKLLSDQSAIVLSSDKEVYEYQEQVTIRVRFFDGQSVPDDDHGVRVELIRDGLATEDIVLSRRVGRRSVFDMTLRDLEPGSYRVRLVSPSVDGDRQQDTFRVRPPQGEMEDLELNEVGLQRASRASGGRYMRWTEAIGGLEELPPGRRVRVSTLPPQTLWNSHAMIALFVIFLGVEWTLRRQWGLI